MKPRVYILSRAPILGLAKTRLASDIGKVHAHRIYKGMIAKVIKRTHDPRWEVIISGTPSKSLGEVIEWQGIRQVSQARGTLSDKLNKIFRKKGPIVVIGTDCPQLNQKDIATAFKALKSYDTVFGPAEDGGFWLIGMNAPLKKDIFRNVRWSHKYTLSDILLNIEGSIFHLRKLTDIDDLNSLLSVKENS
jgi:rSAM/selenodomain-associated transferase 1